TCASSPQGNGFETTKERSFLLIAPRRGELLLARCHAGQAPYSMPIWGSSALCRLATLHFFEIAAEHPTQRIHLATISAQCGLWCSERMTIASLPTYAGQALSRQRWAEPRSRSWPKKWPTPSRPRPGCRRCTIQL